ncbi:MAG: DUF1353 domain-containing protein, partial [Chloroflexi bacterium]|nr:DUF1353 domain-containing protein [Chloroflexota bacterium]
MPFEPDEPVDLRQVGRNTFRLLRPFAYVDTGRGRYEIDPAKVGDTDLASVPWILWWFVASYGRHTRAALVHDQLVDEIDRHEADRVFRRALAEVRVGWARRWLVWATVSFETTFRTFGMADDPAKPGAKRQRKGWWVTVIGFLAVTAHLAVGVGGIAWASGTWWVWQLVAWALLASWLLAWRLRGLLFIVGALLIVPAMLVLLVPLGVVWVFEGGPWQLVRVVWWYL